MSGTQPVGVYAMKVPPGDIMVPAVPEFSAMFRVSMAAIDPSATPELEDVDDKKPPRAILKLIRIPAEMMDEDSDDSEDDDYIDGLSDDEEEESDISSEGELNGGPSDTTKTKKTKVLAIEKADGKPEGQDDEDMGGDEDDLSDADAQAQSFLKKIMKGKDKAVNGEDTSSDLDDDDSVLELEEVVICTLDPEKHYQQPLDFVVNEHERIFFKVSGTHTVYLTGNYLIPIDDGRTSLFDDDEEEDDYDLSPDDDELEALEDGDDESDELDDLADPRITELDSEEEAAPKLAAKVVKGKNKRPAADSDDEEEAANLDDIMAKSLKAEGTDTAANSEPKKLTKSEKKKLKKLKKNDGEAATAPAATMPSTDSKPIPDSKKEAHTNGASSEKKVQFAKNLEQGPTPSATAPSKPEKDSKQAATGKASGAGTLGLRDVQGVTVDERKAGTGPTAKNGSRIELRYVGKFEDGKVFDSNKKGKPFVVKLGAGEVIKGWEIGLAGINAGGERRLIIPPHLAYGKKGSPPDIPPNAKLVFDIRCLAVN